jgi:hypothetical protein
VYYTKEFIQIPNLKEFLYELVKEVRTVRIKKKSCLKLVAINEYNDLQPLVLLDKIPVSDFVELLKLPLDRIEKIEIFDEPYIVTGKKYSGIICFSTKRKDFAGIELDKNSLFFPFSLFSDGHFNKPDFSSGNADRLSYMHNVLFWDPDIELNQHTSQNLTFYTSDSKGEYIVYIRSIDSGGQSQLYGSCRIWLNNQ